MLKRHTSTLSQEKEVLEHKMNEVTTPPPTTTTTTTTSQSDMLQALLKETLLQEPFAHGSAVPQHKVSPQQKQFLKKWIFLQIFLTFK